MKPTKYALIGLTLATILGFWGARIDCAAQESASNEQELIAYLESNAPPAEKALTCKRLSVVGSPAAVPALAALLPDPELSSWTRIALEVIPGPEADQALRQALDQVSGRLLIGVIDSIAVRRDTKAVDRLIEYLDNEDEGVAMAAALALGRIGTEPGCQALSDRLDESRAAVRNAIAEGCVLCAAQQLDAGKNDQAAQLYDRVRQADVPAQRLAEATRGAILATGNIPLLVELIQAEDKDRFQLGLMVSREMAGGDVTEALAAQIADASPVRQSLLVLALADRSDDNVLPVVMKIAASGPKQVRAAAIEVLGQVGDESALDALLEIAASGDDDLLPVTMEALEGLAGDNVNSQLVERLAQADGPMHKAVIQVVGRRRVSDAVPSLMKALEDKQGEVRTAALLALGETVTASDLDVLIQRAMAAVHPSPAEAEAAAKALQAACIRMPDREACAAQLTEALDRAPPSAKVKAIEILGAMGGTQALKTVGQAAKSDDPALQDAASRLLGQWMSPDAAPVLLDLAQNLKQSKYRVRALRGFLRIPRQFDVPVDQAIQMCQDALAAADRDNERELVLDVALRYPSIGMLQIAAELTKNPALKGKATDVSLAIAQKVTGQATDVKKLLEQIGQKPVKIEIVKAEYGAGNKFRDVTATVQKYVGGFPLIALPSASYNGVFGGDPVPGTQKVLKIEYVMDGKSGQATFQENATILLPTP